MWLWCAPCRVQPGRRRASVGDLVIIATFAQVHQDAAAAHRPRLVFVDGQNRQTNTRDFVPTQNN